MKKGYWIILVFAIWCVVSALWYMFSVKGLPDNTGLIKPAPTVLAIVQIILMITIAFILGFGLAWMMRSEPFEALNDEVRNSKYEIRELEKSIESHKEVAAGWERKAQQADEIAVKARLTSDQLTSQMADFSATEEKLKKRNQELEGKLHNNEGELNSIKFRLKVLEGEVADKNKAIGALTQELDEKPKVEHRDWSDHPFVRPVSEAATDERDDLTEIKGIGPAFQRKLNSLDIYTFRQIAELDGESVERLAELIEVFPDRIHRDNWIGQATKLFARKMGRED